MAGIVLMLGNAASPAADQPQQISAIDELGRMSLEELAGLEVTSVSKAPELLRGAPAAIYVITREEIVRSGATRLSEALRLAPNLLVTQLTSSNYMAGARGMGGHPDLQNFSNKLLILIDGRSVYSPLFSGIYHDSQDVLLPDVDRIEVISGPGATLWGANAMHGVINIITRRAWLTDGGLLTAGAGTHEQNAGGRYGGKWGDEIAWRFQGQAFRREALELQDGSDADDDWYKGQAGFRSDWARNENALTLQGDLYRGIQRMPGPGAKQDISGGNAVARWQRQTARSALQVQTYFDHVRRMAPDASGFVLRTFDVELQHAFTRGIHQFIWGGGKRLHHYTIYNNDSLLFVPPERDLHLANVFAQDTVQLGRDVRLTAGVKLEDSPFSGWELMPDLRLAWQFSDTQLFWTSVSRAMRSPTPFDVDVREYLGGDLFITGNADFQPERVTAYEAGYRGAAAEGISLSVSVFYNDYDDLRTIETDPDSGFLPLRWGNFMHGRTYGLTAWAKWQVTDWWRLSPGVTLLRKHLRFDAQASGLLSVGQAGNDPDGHALLGSFMEFGSGMTFDASLRYVGELPDPALSDYYNLNARFGWRVSPALELSLNGVNLLHERHREYPAPGGEMILRGVMVQALWTF